MCLNQFALQVINSGEHGPPPSSSVAAIHLDLGIYQGKKNVSAGRVFLRSGLRRGGIEGGGGEKEAAGGPAVLGVPHLLPEDIFEEGLGGTTHIRDKYPPAWPESFVRRLHGSDPDKRTRPRADQSIRPSFGQSGRPFPVLRTGRPAVWCGQCAHRESEPKTSRIRVPGTFRRECTIALIFCTNSVL